MFSEELPQTISESEKRKIIYQMHKAQTGISIVEQSADNLTTLKNRVHEHYHDDNLLIELRKVWYERIVPDLVLKHVTRDIKLIQSEGKLISVNQRTREGQSINNRHTRGASAGGEYIYFTLGLREHRLEYWDEDEKPHTIMVEIGKAYTDGIENFCEGLWIGSHISPQVSSGYLPSKYFGDTLRSVHYESDHVDLGKKTISYKNQHKEQTIEVDRKTEIFSAEKGLENIFDALFYQVLDEIYYIDGAFKAELNTASNYEKILRLAFKHLFIPDVYPEAKLPANYFSINQNYVSIVSYSPPIKQIHALFDAIHHRNIDEIKSILEDNPEILEVKSNSKTPLLKAVEVFISKLAEKRSNPNRNIKPNLDVVNYLLKIGANFNVQYGPEILIQMLLEHNSEECLTLFKQLIVGIPDMEANDLIRHSFNRQLELLISAALSNNNHIGFNLLLENGAMIKSDINVLSGLFQGLGKSNNFDIFKEYIAKLNLNVNAIDDSGNNLLMREIKNKNFCIFWITNFSQVNINHQNYAGQTALHCAVISKNIEIIKFLLRNVDPTIIDNNGDSAYSLAVSINNEEILNLFQEYEATCIPAPLNEEQTADETRYTVAALAVRITNDRKEFLFIRKKNNIGYPVGHFLFPGGFKDESDSDDMSAVARECLEETGIEINPTSFYRFSWLNEDVLHRCHIGVAELQDAYEPIAMDDVAEAIWINWSEVETDEYGSCFFQGIQIDYGNAILVKAYLQNNLENVQTEIDTFLQQKLGTDKLSELFFKLLDDQNSAELQDQFQLFIKTHHLDITNFPFTAIAAIREKNDAIAKLVEFGADINASFSTGNILYSVKCTALSLAITKSQFDLARKLLELGADFNNPNPEPILPILCCIPENEQSLQFLKLLVETYHAKLSEDIGTKALIVALEKRNFQIVEYLLEIDKFHFIEVNQTCLTIFNKTTAVSTAIRYGALKFFETLHALGIKPELCIDYNAFNVADSDLFKYYCSTIPDVPGEIKTDRPDPTLVSDILRTRAFVFKYWPELKPETQTEKINSNIQKFSSALFKMCTSMTYEQKPGRVMLHRQEQEILKLLFLRKNEMSLWELPFYKSQQLKNAQLCYTFKFCLETPQSHLFYYAFAVEDENSHNKPSNDGCEIKWVSLDELNENFNSADVAMVRKYFNNELQPEFDPDIDCLIFQTRVVSIEINPEVSDKLELGY